SRSEARFSTQLCSQRLHNSKIRQSLAKANHIELFTSPVGMSFGIRLRNWQPSTRHAKSDIRSPEPQTPAPPKLESLPPRPPASQRRRDHQVVMLPFAPRPKARPPAGHALLEILEFFRQHSRRSQVGWK